MKEETLPAEPEVLISTTDVCRDFLRNICYRDKRCKFRHLTSAELSASVDIKSDPASANVVYEFCHDFQNQGCDRPSCKFIHSSIDVEKALHEKGILPLRLKYEFELGVQELYVASSSSALQSGSANLQEKVKPVCRDFMQRQCRRGKKCRFAHVDQNSNLVGDEFVINMSMRQQDPNCDQISHACGENGEKRLRLFAEGCSTETQFNSLSQDAIQHIRQENTMLRKQVANLRKQVTGLSATNEVLLEQNAQFRLHKRYLAEAATPSFSQASKNYGNQSMSMSVPIAMSLSVPAQNQQISNNPGLGATLITSDPLTVTPVELVNSSPVQPTVSVRTHAGVPAQAHIQISRSIPQNSPGMVNTIGTNVGTIQGGLRTNVPVLQQANLAGQSVANFSLTQNTIPITQNSVANFSYTQNTIPITQNLVCSIPSITTSCVSGSVLHNSTIMNGTLTAQNSISLNQSRANQNLAAAGGLVVQANRNITVGADAESLGHMNRNMATAQMTHATLVTTNQQNQSSVRPTAANISASTIAAVAAQVMAVQGSLAQPNNDMGTAQISVPTVPCGTMASAIVPVTITTSLPMAGMVPSLSLNSHGGLLATRMEGGSVVHTHARVSMVNTCPASVNSIPLNTAHHVVNALNGRCIVSGQQQLNAPINFTINPVPSVPQQPGSGMHI